MHCDIVEKYRLWTAMSQNYPSTHSFHLQMFITYMYV